MIYSMFRMGFLATTVIQSIAASSSSAEDLSSSTVSNESEVELKRVAVVEVHEVLFPLVFSHGIPEDFDLIGAYLISLEQLLFQLEFYFDVVFAMTSSNDLEIVTAFISKLNPMLSERLLTYPRIFLGAKPSQLELVYQGRFSDEVPPTSVMFISAFDASHAELRSIASWHATTLQIHFKPFPSFDLITMQLSLFTSRIGELINENESFEFAGETLILRKKSVTGSFKRKNQRAEVETSNANADIGLKKARSRRSDYTMSRNMAEQDLTRLLLTHFAGLSVSEPNDTFDDINPTLVDADPLFF